MFNLCSPKKKLSFLGQEREREKDNVLCPHRTNKKHDFSHLIHISCHPSIICHLLKKTEKNLRRQKKTSLQNIGIRNIFVRQLEVYLRFSGAPSNRWFRNEKTHVTNDGCMVRNFQVGSFAGSDPGALRCLPEFFHQLGWPRGGRAAAGGKFDGLPR